MNVPVIVDAADPDNGRHKQTGPRTPAGKAKSGQNALVHGIRSLSPVIRGEDPEEWESFYTGILAQLSPEGALEQELAGRVALCLWRLRRLARFEVAVATSETMHAQERLLPNEDEPSNPFLGGSQASLSTRVVRLEKELAKSRRMLEQTRGALELIERLDKMQDTESIPGHVVQEVLYAVHDPNDRTSPEPWDREVITAMGVEYKVRENPYRKAVWTVTHLRKGLDACYKVTHAEAAEFVRAVLATRKSAVRRTRTELARTRQKAEAQAVGMMGNAMLPPGKELDKLVRYESHLGRQMLSALHTLERLQATRAGIPASPPAALDVVLHADEQS